MTFGAVFFICAAAAAIIFIAGFCAGISVAQPLAEEEQEQEQEQIES